MSCTAVGHTPLLSMLSDFYTAYHTPTVVYVSDCHAVHHVPISLLVSEGSTHMLLQIPF